MCWFSMPISDFFVWFYAFEKISHFVLWLIFLKVKNQTKKSGFGVVAQIVRIYWFFWRMFLHPCFMKPVHIRFRKKEIRLREIKNREGEFDKQIVFWKNASSTFLKSCTTFGRRNYLCRKISPFIHKPHNIRSFWHLQFPADRSLADINGRVWLMRDDTDFLGGEAGTEEAAGLHFLVGEEGAVTLLQAGVETVVEAVDEGV